MQIGIVGLPFSGKSTLFQAATRIHLDEMQLTRPDPHLAVVKVPDIRLDRLTALFSPKRTVHATIEFIDVAGLHKGESGTTQFTTNFLGNVKTNDALVQVVRAFEDSIDIMGDIATLETEFILADMTIVETRLERIAKQTQKARDDNARRELPLLEKCNRILQDAKPLREADFSADEAHALKTYQLLSLKPMLIALNFDESRQGEAAEVSREVGRAKEGRMTKVVSFFGKIDREMSELPPEEARAFMAEYGIRESALDTLIREAYALLGLRSFFTVGEDECRAWTIRAGMNAQEAAGVIHSDFFNKFIRAEVVHYDHFIAHDGSFAKAKDAGHWRLEGKEYVVMDGDILNIRHS
jgi:hypothetical protein